MCQRQWLKLDGELRFDSREYGIVAAVVGTVTILGSLLPIDYYLAVGLVYLLAVISLSLRVGRWPVLAAGVISALSPINV